MNETPRILVTRLRFMGDIILTTPVLQALRDHFPHAHITYMAQAPYHTLLFNHPAVDHILFYGNSLKSQIQTVRYLIRNKFDIAIDLFGNPRSAWLTLLSGAKIRIGGDFRGRRMAYSHPVRQDGRNTTAIQFHMAYLQPLGISQEPKWPGIYLDKKETEWAEQYLRKKGYDPARPIVGIHPGATWPAKRWSNVRYAELVKYIASEPGVQVFITMGPEEQQIIEPILSMNPDLKLQPETMSIREMAAIISRMQVFISNDAGPMHLGPALGVRTIGLFGPGEPEIWFPYSTREEHQVIHHELICSRCHQDFCDKMHCMSAISVDEVLSAVKKALVA